MDKELLKQIITDQGKSGPTSQLVTRAVYTEIPSFQNNPHIIIILGVRRCGKSTLLQVIRQHSKQQDYYLNFDDERLVQFELSDFQNLYDLFIEIYGEQQTFYFDEIQNIPEWERFVRRLHDTGHKVYITGSNAALFSQELGTRLTGRYIEVPMYPFSYHEFIQFHEPNLLQEKLLTSNQKGYLKHLLLDYIDTGGIPEYIFYKNKDYLNALYESIIYRDIVARYKISEVMPLKNLVFYLAGNVGKDISYNALKEPIGVKSATTVSDYCNYIKQSFLCFFINRFSHSLKKQFLYSKKVYFIDTALAKQVGFRTSDDKGRLLENIVFLELLRKKYEVYFHRDHKECDFIIRERGKITLAIQVCYTLQDKKTREREIAGLLEAMQAYQLSYGLILTWDEEQEKAYKDEEFTIDIIPTYQWLLK